jgi:phosphoribosylanthranilate isomerase
MTRIKICGITNKADAIAASDLGADMLGFIFYDKSKRYVEPKTARDIINEIPQSVQKVGVFVNAPYAEMVKIAEDAPLDIIQLHGDETPDTIAALRREGYKVIKAFRIKDRTDLKKVNDYDADYYLFDTYKGEAAGGTGEVFDWKILKDFETLKPVILSGGLNPANIVNAIKEVAPFAVDVSSGVERSIGKKDIGLMTRFIENVRRAQ